MLMNAIMFLCAVLDIQILYTYFRGMFHQKKETISRIGVYAAFIGTEILLYLVTLFASDLSGPLRITIQLGSSILTTLGLTFLYESSLRYSIIVTLCFQAYSCIAELVSGGLLYLFLIESASKHAGDRRSDPAFDLQVYPSASCSRNNVSMAAQRIIL